MRMSRNGFIIHFVISLKPDRPYKATVVYNLATVVYSDIPRQTVVYQLYTTARGFDVAHAKCYIKLYGLPIIPRIKLTRTENIRVPMLYQQVKVMSNISGNC